MLSNGPGDPAVMPAAVQTIKEMLNDHVPVLEFVWSPVIGRSMWDRNL